MKKIKLLTLLSSLFTRVVLTESCDKAEELLDPCASVTCQNDGVCVDGTCDCPDGFSGTSCEIQDLCFGITCENNGSCIEGICDCPDGYIGSSCENFDSTQVQALLANHTPIDLVSGGVPIDSLYGKMYNGGLIFYLNTTDGTGMVAATEDQSTGAGWGCSGTDISGLANATMFPVPNPETEAGALIGDGAANTTAILDGCNPNDGIAARLCRDIGAEWFLPCRGELNLMYTNLHQNGTGGFAVDFYWSSTELDVSSAWVQHFNAGDQFNVNKDFNVLVRAARAF